MTLSALFSGLSFFQKTVTDKRKFDRDAQRDSALTVREAADCVRTMIKCANDLDEMVRQRNPAEFEDCGSCELPQACRRLEAIDQKIDDKSPLRGLVREWYGKIQALPVAAIRTVKAYDASGNIKGSYLRSYLRDEGNWIRYYPKDCRDFDALRKDLVIARAQLSSILAEMQATATLLESGTYGRKAKPR